MTARPGEAPGAEATACTQQLIIRAPRERVFGAIAFLDGLRCWWTTIVTGSAAPGGTLHFGFAGLDEQIAMRVDAVRPLSAVAWSCVAHSRDDEWTGSTVRFGLADRGPQACELDFRHTGIGRDLAAEGWKPSWPAWPPMPSAAPAARTAPNQPTRPGQYGHP